MANKTVYPFGTDGQLPSSVGIIDDCVTGGADKALSAQQGVVLNQKITNIEHNQTYDTPVDVYALPEYSYVMADSGVWDYQDGSTNHKAKTALIPLSNVDKVLFSISANTRIAMLRSNNMEDEVAMDFASGWDAIMKPTAGDYVFDVPYDATFLAIATAGVSGTDARYIYDITLKTISGGSILYVNDIVDGLDSEDSNAPLSANQGKVLNDKLKVLPPCDTLSFPVMGCGNKMLSLPVSTYTHLPTVRETDKFIFLSYVSSKVNTTEVVGQDNELTLCVISKATGEIWYETVYDGANPDKVDGYNCEYCHHINMIDVSDDTVVMTTGCVNNGKFLFAYKTYDATSRTMSAMTKATITYGGNTYDLNLRNYIQMANSVYSLSITESDKVANTEDIWNPSKYDDNGTTKYIALFSFRTKTSTTGTTPYIMMVSTDAKDWTPLFLLQNDLKSGESSAIVVNSKIYLTNRIGGSFLDDQAHGQFYGVCDMSGTMLKAWEKINVQRTRPCEVAIDGTVYIMYNDGTNSGKYWGRTKAIIAKVNADYSLTEIKSFVSPFGINYPSICDHNGAMLIAYAEDMRGYNAGTNNAVTDIAIAQLFDLS